MSTAYSFRHFHLKLLVNLLMLLLLCSSGFSSNDYDVEGHALIELLKALNDTNNRNTDWNIHLVSPCFSWSHVTCRNGNVISLSLASNGFSGTLSPSITKLKYLVSLYCTGGIRCEMASAYIRSKGVGFENVL